jgi:hypothetical protein
MYTAGMTNGEGKKPKPGDTVVLTQIPSGMGMLNDLPMEDQEAISEIVGKPILLREYDNAGRAELEFKDGNRNFHYVYVNPEFIRKADRRRYQLRWFHLLPTIHLCACFISYVGLVLPSPQYLGILFTFILLADVPISLPAYILGWKYSALAVIWIFVAGTFWWYLLGRGADALFTRFIRRNQPIA